MLGTEPRASGKLGKQSTTELYLQALLSLFDCGVLVGQESVLLIISVIIKA
jgi:hypothetical protein